MSSPPDPSEKPSAHDRALDALQKRIKPQPRPADTPFLPAQEQAAGSGSATGFVSILAKRQPENAPTIDAGRPVGEALHMAREIPPATRSTPASPPAVPPPATAASIMPPGPLPAPGAHRRIPEAAMIALAVVLLPIGIWAAGAIVYMHRVTPASPREVRYPLINWSYAAGSLGDYTPESRLAAWTMLLCLPLAAVLLVWAVVLLRRGMKPA